MAGDATDYDDTFRVQDLNELEFRNGNLEHGFNCLVGHHEIEPVGFLGNGLEATRWFEAIALSASLRLPPVAAVLDYVRRRPRKRHMPGLLHRGGIRHLLLFMFVSQPKGQHL
uniref:Uncharacterized protein n=1 Tax=Setaria viridis TaxID=4556 RepID=A0A4U6VRN7_SETVI|nr:hypothetical protein SEVIR_2G094000v2 [Setaria viridis]